MRSSPVLKRARSALKDPCILISLIVLVLLTVFNVIRAATMPITIDESRTYFQTMMHGPRVIAFQFHGQNHTLQSLLSYFGTRLFGLSLLSLRLGSVLGSIIYTVASIRLSRMCTRTKWMFVLSILALTVNPVILDFAVVARGYSLALALFMVSLSICAHEIQRKPSLSGPRKSILIALSCVCSLSVLANLSFAFANFSLLAVFVSWSTFRTTNKPAWSSLVINLLLLAIPGSALFVLMNPGVFQFSMVTFYFGSASWFEFYESVTRVMFDSLRSPFALIRYLPLVLGLVVLIYLASVVIPSLRRWRLDREALNETMTLWMFILAILAATVALHSLFHVLFSRPLPQDRTGLFLVPLATLIVVLSITGLEHSRSAFLGKAVLGALVVGFLLCLRTSWVYVWKFDSGGPEVSAFISQYGREHNIAHAGTQWPLAEALRFYPTLRKQPDTVELHELNSPADASREDLFVLHKRNSPFVSSEHLKIVFEHPLSEVVVAVRE